VNFGGLLAGHSTSVNADGVFRYLWEPKPGDVGSVSAQAVAPNGDVSNIEWVELI
jgi:hypothetical protein